MNLRSLPILLTIAVISICPTARAVEFYPITEVTNTNSTNFFAKDNLIQGSGVGFDAAEPHAQLGTGGGGFTWVTNGNTADWFNGALPDPVFWFDLGSDVALTEVSTWGYADTNTNGLKDFSLRFATAAEGTDGFGATISYSPAFEAAFNYGPRTSNEFTQPVFARYVEMTMTDNWKNLQGATPGGDRVGLGEVAFEIPQASGEANIVAPAEVTPALTYDAASSFDVPVGNTGDQDLNITGTAFIGPNASAFSVTAVTSPVEPQTTENISIEFDPTGLGGPISATLQITSNDPDTPVAEVLISGSLAELGPDISVPGMVAISGAGTLTITVTNAGRSQLDLSGASLSGPEAAAFAITTEPAAVAPLDSGDILVSFDPGGAGGSFSATLVINSNDPDTPMAEVQLSGGVASMFFPIAEVTNTNSSNFFAKDNLIQGIGIGFDSFSPHGQLGGGGGGFTWVTDAPGADYYDFLPAPVLWFDLGSDVALNEISTWGYADTNTNGAKDFSLRFATAAEGTDGFGTSIAYNPTFEAAFNYGPRDSQGFSEAVSARYVEMTITDNWRGLQDGIPGGDRVGLGEVAFEITGAIPGNDFRITRITLSGGDVTLIFKSRPSAEYSIWRTSDLRTPLDEWEELVDTHLSDGEFTTYTDDNVPVGSTRLFYQVRPGL